MNEANYYADVIAHRDLSNGDELVVLPLTFGRARLGVGKKLDGWYRDVW